MIPDQTATWLQREAPYVAVVIFLAIYFVAAFVHAVLVPSAPTESPLPAAEAGRGPSLSARLEQAFEGSAARRHVFLLGVGAMLAAMVGGVAILIWWAARLARRRALLAPESGPAARWTLWDVFKAAAVYLALVIVISGFIERPVSIETSVGPWVGEFVARTAMVWVVLATMMRGRGEALTRPGSGYACPAAPLIGLLRRLGLAARGCVGAVVGLWLRRARLWKRARQAGVAYLGFVPIYVGVMLVQTSFAGRLGIDTQEQEAMLVIENTTSGTILAIVILFAVVVAPLTEELYFRGFLLPALRKRLSAREAILLSAFFFAVIHRPWIALVPIFLLGVLLGYVCDRTRSLAGPIVIHAAHNASMLASFFWVKAATGT